MNPNPMIKLDIIGNKEIFSMIRFSAVENGNIFVALIAKCGACSSSRKPLKTATYLYIAIFDGSLNVIKPSPHPAIWATTITSVSPTKIENLISNNVY